MDNEQFQFGQSLRPGKGPFGLILDGLKNFYLTRLKGLDLTKICVATIVMEGNAKEVAAQEDKLTEIGLSFQGIPAGEHNGKRGYQLTFAIAYIRVNSFVSPIWQSEFTFYFLFFLNRILEWIMEWWLNRLRLQFRGIELLMSLTIQKIDFSRSALVRD